MLKYVFLLFPFTTTVVFGQLDEAKRFTQTLCSAEMHGRGYVQKGDSLAAEFIAKTFKKAGLKPLKKTYFQSFQFPVHTFPGEIRVVQNNRELKPGIHYLVHPASNAIRGTLRPKLIPIEIALHTDLLIPEIQSLQHANTFNAIAFSFKNVTGDSLKRLTAIAREVAAYYPVIEITNKKFTWSVASKPLPNAYIQVQDSVYTYPSSLTLEIAVKTFEKYQSRNVIGYLPAKKKTKKTILFTAHYDHLGRLGKDTYFPGANDNASGTAMLVTLANHFRENRIDCNLLFIAFAGEEAGLIGSKYFVEHPPIDLKNIAFLLNLDIMGSGEEGITVVNATLHDQSFQLLNSINSEKQLFPTIKSRGPAANSDHHWFTEKDIPAFYIYTMGANKNYHDIFDTYENLSFSAYLSLSELLIAFTQRLIQ
jgi:hypothetical protein